MKVLSISTLVFSFYHLSSQNQQLVYTPSHLLVQYTRMGGGRGNCQQPTLYTYVTWPLFAYLCLALSLSCWPKNSPGQLSNPPVTLTKIYTNGGEKGGKSLAALYYLIFHFFYLLMRDIFFLNPS